MEGTFPRYYIGGRRWQTPPGSRARSSLPVGIGGCLKNPPCTCQRGPTAPITLPRVPCLYRKPCTPKPPLLVRSTMPCYFNSRRSQLGTWDSSVLLSHRIPLPQIRHLPHNTAVGRCTEAGEIQLWTIFTSSLHNAHSLGLDTSYKLSTRR